MLLVFMRADSSAKTPMSDEGAGIRYARKIPLSFSSRKAGPYLYSTSNGRLSLLKFPILRKPKSRIRNDNFLGEGRREQVDLKIR